MVWNPVVSLLRMPPWALVSLGMGSVAKWQEIKQVSQLSWLAIRGTDGAKCELCTVLVGIMLAKLDVTALNDGTIDCQTICLGLPFKAQCIGTCGKIIGAMENSTAFPCNGAGFCPAVDEFGRVSCTGGPLGCTPKAACFYQFPGGCQLKPGVASWRRMTHLVSTEIGALGAAFRQRPPLCSQAKPNQPCILDPVGTGMLANYVGLGLYVYGLWCSLLAIESPGGDDDRQWLTFWLIALLLTFTEGFYDLLLSRLPIYYELKLSFLIWLIFRKGADEIYRELRRPVAWLVRRRRVEPLDEEVVALLPASLRERYATLRDSSLSSTSPSSSTQQPLLQPLQQPYRQVLEELCSSRELARCQGYVVNRHGIEAWQQLTKQWNRFDPRFLQLRIVRASGLPNLDDPDPASLDQSDAYVVAYLMAPSTAPSTAPITAPITAPAVEQAPLAYGLAYGMLPAGMGEGVLASAFAAAAAYGPTALHELASKFRHYARVGLLDSRLPEGAYGRVSTRVVRDSREPYWNEAFELRLEGGATSSDGIYDNDEAPFTRLVLEVWDRDSFIFGRSDDDYRDDLIGVAEIKLTPLMDGRTHTYEDEPLRLPGRSEQRGAITVQLRFEGTLLMYK